MTPNRNTEEAFRRGLLGINLDRRIERFVEFPFWGYPAALPLSILACLIPAILIITTPLSLTQQLVLAIGTFLVALWLDRLQGRLASLAMMMLSLLMSCRYMYWRLTETLGWGMTHRDGIDTFFSFGLVCAELYAFVVLFLGYFQVLWPLQRKPTPLPRNLDEWPTVDIYIPTYNEPLSVVRPTILAAMDMDWPREKLRVYVLDDGRREEFRQFCEEVGVTHLTRADSKHAKAGNLNRAMAKTTGEFIAIFDCDHIPTRSFLQITMGWMKKDPRAWACSRRRTTSFPPTPSNATSVPSARSPTRASCSTGCCRTATTSGTPPSSAAPARCCAARRSRRWAGSRWKR